MLSQEQFKKSLRKFGESFSDEETESLFSGMQKLADTLFNYLVKNPNIGNEILIFAKQEEKIIYSVKESLTYKVTTFTCISLKMEYVLA